MGSCGISALTACGFGAPEMTTKGGAGDVLSDTGDRRGVIGGPTEGFGWRPPSLDV
jgi:hypothetical protein